MLAGLVTAGILAVVLLSSNPPDRNALPGSDSPTALIPRPERTAPPASARQIHRALHGLGKICKPDDTTVRTARARPPVKAILSFARRYPNVSFAIDDETGTTVTLLMVTREALRTCAPSLMAQVNQSLPPEYRSTKASRP